MGGTNKVQLSAELKKALGGASVMLPKKKLTTAEKHLIKKQKKETASRFRQAKQREKQREKALLAKAKTEERKRLFMSLSSNSLSQEEMAVMDTTRTLGKRKTSKQKASLSMKKLRSGLELDLEERDALFAERPDTAPKEPDLTIVDQVVRVSSRPRRKRRVLLDTSSVQKSSIVDDDDDDDLSSSSSSCSSVCDVPVVADAAAVEEVERVFDESDDDVDAPIVVEPLADVDGASSSFVVHVQRDPDVEKARHELPVCAEEQLIMETINANGVSLICAETGSGKTTQVPQFLYEAGYGCAASKRPGLIGVTQPRRVAAVSTARRVAFELGDQHGQNVAYQVRFDSNVASHTRVKFMTDGVLLREVQHDLLLRKYSVLVLDEAHERNLATDLLIGLLSRIVPLRNRRARSDTTLTPLRVVIMSATLRVDDFTSNKSLFPQPPPVVRVGSRQHPVTVHFSRRTELDDFVQAAFEKTCRVHSRLPPGGILVFLTGRMEIERMCRLLRRKFNRGHVAPAVAQEDKEDKEKREHMPTGRDLVEADADEEEQAICQDEDDAGEEEAEQEEQEEATRVRVLPLYALLSKAEQMRVFDTVPEGERLIVVATNVAETSLTIPGIRYVVDCGREKARVFERSTGVSRFVVQWISRASANQRAGRAGRTAPGHAYRLYSSAVFNDQFKEFAEPEILRLPIDGIVLHMKAMGIERVAEFPFPTPPSMDGLRMALSSLTALGALEPHGAVTAIGRTMGVFPLAPRFAKMLALADQGACLPYAIAIVAALTVDNLFVAADNNNDDDDSDDDEGKVEKIKCRQRMQSARIQFVDRGSDLLTSLSVVCAFDYASDPLSFCRQYFLRPKAMFEVRRLREQLHRVVDRIRDSAPSFRERLRPPSETQRALLAQIIMAGFVDHVAQRWTDTASLPPDLPQHLQRAAYRCSTTDAPVFIHPSSALFPAVHQPELLVFRELIVSSRPYLRGVTRVTPHHLFRLAPTLCDVSAPLDEPMPSFDADADAVRCNVNVTFAPLRMQLPTQQIAYPSGKAARAWFARLLLDGAVLPHWKRLRPLLCVRTAALTAPMLTSKKLIAFLRALESGHVQDRASLVRQWQSSDRFLYVELKALVQPQAHAVLQSVWKESLAFAADVTQQQISSSQP